MSAIGLAIRAGPWSRLVRPYRSALLVVFAGMLTLALLTAVALGSTPLPLARVVAALLGTGDAIDRLIVTDFRLPRVLLAIEAGCCLAAAGLLLQCATRNALASPDVIGIVDGAALGVVLFLALLSDSYNALTVSIHWQPMAAVLGAALFVALMFALARRQAVQPIRLILFGVAIAAAAKAATTIAMIVGPIYTATQALHWLVGSVNTATWREVTIVAVVGAPLLVLAGLLARSLDLLDLDPDSARGLGLGLSWVRLASVLLAACLTATAVAFVGGVGFVGLLAPHLARLLLGRGAAATLGGGMLAGALIVLAADLVVRVLFAPLEVPAGAITAIVGAPYFLYVLNRRSPADG